jgi:hypothetical protein
MKKALVTLAFLSVSAFGSSFSKMAHDSVNAILTGAQECSLLVLDAYDPRLPYPQVPADTAITTKHGRVLAYFLELHGFGSTMLFKNPNGGMVHSVTYGREGIRYVTPYAGVIAHGNRYMTVGGPGYNLYCHSQPVNGAGFEVCVKRAFVDYVLQQLCLNAVP